MSLVLHPDQQRSDARLRADLLAPRRMLTLAVSSLLGLAVSPAAHNPNLVILFSSFAGAMTVASLVFGWLFWSSD